MITTEDSNHTRTGVRDGFEFNIFLESNKVIDNADFLCWALKNLWIILTSNFISLIEPILIFCLRV